MAVSHCGTLRDRGGDLLLSVAFLAFLVSVSVPFWSGAEDWQEGLWNYRLRLLNEGGVYYTYSGEYSFADYPAWFHTVRVLECLCVVGTLAACVLIAVTTSCCWRSPEGFFARVIWILTTLSGMLGFIGCMVHRAMRVSTSRHDLKTAGEGSLGVFTSRRDVHFLWAFYLAAISSFLIVIAAVISIVINLSRTSQDDVTSVASVAGSQAHRADAEPGCAEYAMPFDFVQPHPYVYLMPAAAAPQEYPLDQRSPQEDQPAPSNESGVAPPAHPRDQREDNTEPQNAPGNVSQIHPYGQCMAQEY